MIHKGLVGCQAIERRRPTAWYEGTTEYEVVRLREGGTGPGLGASNGPLLRQPKPIVPENAVIIQPPAVARVERSEIRATPITPALRRRS